MNNHCGSCKHKQMPEGGHCYMFRTEPETPCAQHTNIALKAILRKNMADRTIVIGAGQSSGVALMLTLAALKLRDKP